MVNQVEVITKVFMVPVINYNKWYEDKRKVDVDEKGRSTKVCKEIC